MQARELPVGGRGCRLINTTTVMCGQSCGNATADKPVIFFQWNMEAGDERTLQFPSPRTGLNKAGCAHHDFIYNQKTQTIMYMFRFQNNQYDLQESPELIVEMVVEVDLTGRTVWSWVPHKSIPFREMLGEDLKEGECKEHFKKSCLDVFHANTIWWDMVEKGDGEGILYWNSRHRDTFWKIDKWSKRIIWALGSHGNLTQFDLFGKQQLKLLTHAHAVQLLGPNQFIAFDNGEGSAGYSRMVIIQVDERQMVAREVRVHHIPHSPRCGIPCCCQMATCWLYPWCRRLLWR